MATAEDGVEAVSARRNDAARSVMPWDDELERLVNHIRRHSGTPELKAASARALSALKPVPAGNVSAKKARFMAALDGRWYEVDAYCEALRSELRRRMTQQ